MEKDSQKISVRIGGMTYNLISGQSEEYTRQIAARADEMIRRVSMTSPHLSQQMTTVLALVNAVDDLARQSGQLVLAEQQRDATEAKNAELRAELAKLRELNWEMKKDLLHLSALVREQERQPSQRLEPVARPIAVEKAVAAVVAAPAMAVVPATSPAAEATKAAAEAAKAAEPARAGAADVPPLLAAEAQLPRMAEAQMPRLADETQMPLAAAEAQMPLAVAEAQMPLAAAEPAMPLASLEPSPVPAPETRPPATTARILPPLGFGRSRDTKAKPLGSPLKSWQPNPWAEVAEPLASESGLNGPFDDTVGPVDLTRLGAEGATIPAEPSPAPAETAPTAEPVAGNPAKAETTRDAAAEPYNAAAASRTAAPLRHLDEMRQTGLEEYLTRYGQGRSIVQDLRPDDEP